MDVQWGQGLVEDRRVPEYDCVALLSHSQRIENSGSRKGHPRESGRYASTAREGHGDLRGRLWVVRLYGAEMTASESITRIGLGQV